MICKAITFHTHETIINPHGGIYAKNRFQQQLFWLRP